MFCNIAKFVNREGCHLPTLLLRVKDKDLILPAEKCQKFLSQESEDDLFRYSFVQ